MHIKIAPKVQMPRYTIHHSTNTAPADAGDTDTGFLYSNHKAVNMQSEANQCKLNWACLQCLAQQCI